MSQLKAQIIDKNQVLRYTSLDREATIELQEILQSGEYYQGKIDGIPGNLTKIALAQFKKDCYMSDPELIGAGTVKLLLKLKEKSTISEQVPYGKTTLDPNAGKNTGKTVVLATGQRVYSNEYILPGVPLTWKEMTKDLTRIPHSKEVVTNIVEVAKEFGKVRSDFNQPIRITSGYRPPHLKIGAKGSLHKVGAAIDMTCMDYKDLPKLWNILKSSKFVGLGNAMQKGKFCHADLRKTSYKRIIFGY